MAFTLQELGCDIAAQGSWCPHKPTFTTMRILTHWNPLRVQELQNRVLHALQTSPSQCENGQCKPSAVADWVPVVDVVEDEKEYLIKAELPEVSKDNVRVTVEKGKLTLSGERKFEEESGKKYHRVERSYGSFARTFNLPENVDAECSAFIWPRSSSPVRGRSR